MAVARRAYMSTLGTKLAIASLALIAVASQACTLASPTTVEMKPIEDTEKQDSDATDSTSSTKSTSAAATTCNAKLVKVDVSKLTACGDGAGHCYPKSKTPGASAMAACPNAGPNAGPNETEVCVEDAILTAGGGKLKSCKVAVLSNAAGACIALGTMPEGSDKEQAKANLKRDVCAEGELCAPCTNPLQGNADTGICNAVGVSDSDCGASTGDTSKTTEPAKPAPTCCGGKGTCLASAGDTTKDLKQDSCTEGLVCAPASLVSNKATKCNGGLLGKGICMDGCFNDMLKSVGSIFLGQDVCGAGESCVPCTFASGMAPDGVKVPGCE